MIGDNKITSGCSPFGNPDGSRAELEDVLRTFVSFSSEGEWGGLAVKKNDLSARIIVGRKGAGKTVYLRRLQATASEDDSLYADAIQQSLPTTNEIIKFCQLFKEYELTEQWMLLWRSAIFRSLVSHLTCSNDLKEYIRDEDMSKIKKYQRSLLREVDEVVSIYSQVSEIINQYTTANQIVNYLRDPDWAVLETLIGRIIKDCPPMCFYVDAVDEEFSHAPMYWLRCQKGLFYQVMRFLRDAKLGGRLHIVICIRDLVLASVFKSEHATRYIGEPHIKILNWSKDSMGYFFDRKIERLSNVCFAKKTNIKNAETWLGWETIENTYYNINEPIKQYIMRHTRLLPRDIVILGNSLCQKFQEKKGQLTQEDIRDVVSRYAASFGNEQLMICANQIASDSMPAHAQQHNYSDFYTGNKEYSKTKKDDLVNLIKSIGKDKFSLQELEAAIVLSKKLFGEKNDPFSVLWQNGLLGYLLNNNRESKYVFYSEEKMDEFNLPLNQRKYVFHPCMVDAVCLKGTGKKPVIPYG